MSNANEGLSIARGEKSPSLATRRQLFLCKSLLTS